MKFPITPFVQESIPSSTLGVGFFVLHRERKVSALIPFIADRSKLRGGGFCVTLVESVSLFFFQRCTCSVGVICFRRRRKRTRIQLVIIVIGCTSHPLYRPRPLLLANKQVEWLFGLT